MNYPAWYGVLVGILMIIQWTFSIATGGVPEFETTPWAIGFHLAGEISTALMLIIGGIASLRFIHWGKPILLAGLGMVIYSEIVSPGYFADQGQWAMVALFAVLLFGAVWGVMKLLSTSTNARTGIRS
jgi:hypothetical protein